MNLSVRDKKKRRNILHWRQRDNMRLHWERLKCKLHSCGILWERKKLFHSPGSKLQTSPQQLTNSSSQHINTSRFMQHVCLGWTLTTLLLVWCLGCFRDLILQEKWEEQKTPAPIYSCEGRRGRSQAHPPPTVAVIRTDCACLSHTHTHTNLFLPFSFFLSFRFSTLPSSHSPISFSFLSFSFAISLSHAHTDMRRDTSTNIFS